MDRYLRLGVAVLAALVLPSCFLGNPNPHDGQLIYTSPGGLQVWGYGDDMQGALTGPPVQTSDGLRWMRDGYGTWTDMGNALDLQVLAYIAAHPTMDPDAIWTGARGVKYYLEDDFLFPDVGSPVDAVGPYAAGETIQNPDDPTRDAKIYLAIWTKVHGDSHPPAGTPPWTIRTWSTSPFYSYGAFPWVPALSYELGWIFHTN